MPPATTTPSWHDCRAGASSSPAFARKSTLHAPGSLIVLPANARVQNHRALGGNQTDIKPPQPPQHGARCLFKSTQASCQQKTRCAEVRSVATAPPRLLGPCFPAPRFPGERRDPGTTELWTATKRTSSHQAFRSTEGAVRQESSSTVPAENLLPCGPCRGNGTTAAPGPPAFLPLVFPANAGTQGPPSSGWRPKGHRATKGSAVRSARGGKRRGSTGESVEKTQGSRQRAKGAI